MTASRLRVRAYVSPVPAPRQTGVGRHTVEMLRQLDLRRDQVAVSLLVPSGALGSVRNSLPPALRSVRLEPLAGPEFLTRRLLIATTIVPADYGLGGDDWVYCPTMQPVYCGRARLAVTIHDSVSFERDGALGEPVGWRKALKDRLALNRTVRRAALVCVVSEHLKRRIQQIVPAADKARFVVVGNGAADVFYEPASDADVDILGSYALAGTRFVIAVGDMIYRKGADLLLQLASELRARKSGIEVAVAGRNRDERYCSDADLRNSKIRLLGHVPAERLAVLLRRSVALVLPSRYESFGIPAVEAMAAGTPVISSRAHALPEVVGDAGLYFDMNSPGQLVQRVEEVAGCENLRNQMVMLGRERARRFKWADCASRLIAAMRETTASD